MLTFARPIKFCFLHPCRSIVNKHVELEALLHVQNLNLLIGTESHLDEGVMSSEIFPPQYNIYLTYRHDRNRHGGGVFILVRSDIPSSLIHVSKSIEQIWIHIHEQYKQSIILGSVYFPPNSPITVLEELQVTISEIKSTYPTVKVLLGGDFNSPGINWHHKVLLDSYVPASFREKLLEMAEDFHFEQLVTTPTRGSNILDLFFISHPDLVLSCQTAPSISDHDLVIVEFLTQIKLMKRSPRDIFLYHKANWDLIQQKMARVSVRYFDLNSIGERSVEENWNFFHEQYLQLIEEYVPKKTLSTKSHLPWMNTTLKQLLKKKQRTYNRAKKYHRKGDWDE